MWWRRKRARPGRLVVGLGNPGPGYADTRHNVGVRVLERFAARCGAALDAKRYRSRFGAGALPAPQGGEALEVGLLAPQTFMNRSGEAVAAALADLPVAEPAHLIVVFDDVDLPFGRLRLRPGGGAGGHRGLADVIERLGRSDFPRLRVGVDRPPPGVDTAAYVLEPFNSDEAARLPDLLERACQALECALREGVLSAMNRFNKDDAESG